MTSHYRICWKCSNGEVEKTLPIKRKEDKTLDDLIEYLNICHPGIYVEYLDLITESTEETTKPYDLIVMEVMTRFADAAGLTPDELDGLEQESMAIDEAIANKVNKGLGEPHISIETLLTLQENYDNNE